MRGCSRVGPTLSSSSVQPGSRAAMGCYQPQSIKVLSPRLRARHSAAACGQAPHVVGRSPGQGAAAASQHERGL